MIHFHAAARAAVTGLCVLLGGTLAVTPARAEPLDSPDGTREAALLAAAAPAGFQDAFVGWAGPLAQQIHNTYDIPASVTLAQSILESDWGRSTLATAERNLFGFKCVAPDNPGPIATHCATYPTTECAPPPCHPVDAFFRSYGSIEDSYRDYGRLLTTSANYAAALPSRHDPDAFIRAVAQKYATDPGYADKVIQLMDTFGLRRFD